MLADSQKRAYARQILLPEIGVAGQERLCDARVRQADSEAPADAVARTYLARAGVSVAADGCMPLAPAFADASQTLEALAGDPRLSHAAAWLVGAFSAVETIKQVLALDQPATLPENASFSLAPAPEDR